MQSNFFPQEKNHKIKHQFQKLIITVEYTGGNEAEKNLSLKSLNM